MNFFGAAACCSAALPLLRKAKGRIVNISSVAAVYAIPFQAMYSASKAALNAYSSALAGEIAHFGVSVCTVMPGDVKTGFTQARRKEAAGTNVSGARSRPPSPAWSGTRRTAWPRADCGESRARLAGRRRVAPVYTVGAQYKLLLFLGRLLPHSLIGRVVGRMYVKE